MIVLCIGSYINHVDQQYNQRHNVACNSKATSELRMESSFCEEQTDGYLEKMVNDTESYKNVPYEQRRSLRVESQTLLILCAVLVLFVHELFRNRVEYLYVFLNVGGRSFIDNVTHIMVSF